MNRMCPVFTLNACSLFRQFSTLTSKRIFSQHDVNTFAQISGDKNPIHVDTSENNKYGNPIVHGTLILGQVSGMLADAAPGALLLNLNVSFTNYLHVQEELNVIVAPVKLQRARLNLDVKGFTDNKSIFSGNLDIGVTKTMLRKILADRPELVIV